MCRNREHESGTHMGRFAYPIYNVKQAFQKLQTIE